MILMEDRPQFGAGSAVRGVSVNVRKRSPTAGHLPGYFEIDFVPHCGGGKVDSELVHTLVMTDIATGWTECLIMPFRRGAFVLEHIRQVRGALPFPLRGLDSDNDSAFMNETVCDFCKPTGTELTRSRAYKKNDEAWV
ncbi:hypothetical protein [Paraburkholderia youngii]|uniref:hypothetical protein n=1 Tax=Paraburkholderia youngii TaxID=2782701 RepID=UPI00159555FD|nr:hypothetical protein [Paraburkholderia youngii]